MLILAPMAGVTTSAFRCLAKSQGCDFVVSEMVSAKGLQYGNKTTEQLLRIKKEERPMAIQLFGSDPHSLSFAAQRVEEEYWPEMIDLNMGCPTPKIVKNHDGSALMRNPSLAFSCAEAVVRAVKTPVTVKIRSGWDENCINAVEFAKGLEQAGVHWITLHARTRSQFYSGEADWGLIKEVKEAVRIPIVGNGDIASCFDAKRMLHETGCDHLMIGRGVMGNPFLFREVKTYLEEGIVLPPASLQEKVSMALKHVELEMQERPEFVAVRSMRSQLSWYLKGVRFSSQVRAALNSVGRFLEVKVLLESLLEEEGEKG